MKCEVCGYTSSTNFQFCKYCGAPAPDKTFINHPNPKTLLSIKSGLFLAICILFTASSILNPFNIINVICTIALWLIYANGRKNIINPTHIKILSGCTFATEIIMIIEGIGVILFSSIFTISAIIVPFADTSTPTYSDSYYSSSSSADSSTIGIIVFLILGISLFIAGIVIIILSFTTLHPTHKFIKSLYNGIENGVEDVHNPKKARIALIVIAILSIIGLLAPFVIVLIPFYGLIFMVYLIPYLATAISASLVPIALILSGSIIKKNFIN